MHLFRRRAEESGIDLSVVLSDAPGSILVDGRRIKQFLVNLLGNALKFTPDNGTIVMRANLNDEGRLVLSVRDSGIGMAEKDIERALQPFSQLDADISLAQEGVGLGLSIASRLTALHDGELRITSKPGVGTLAQVLLPASRIVKEQDPLPSQSGA
ncbi:MAG: ATP-binding protein [Alphaproteobacteria bacterium]